MKAPRLFMCAHRAHIRKAEKPVISRLSALLLARQKELESPTFRLGGNHCDFRSCNRFRYSDIPFLSQLLRMILDSSSDEALTWKSRIVRS